jgi:hypothetical protein
MHISPSSAPGRWVCLSCPALTQILFITQGEFSAAQRFIGLYIFSKDKIAAAAEAGVVNPDVHYRIIYSVLIAMVYSGIYIKVRDRIMSS